MLHGKVILGLFGWLRTGGWSNVVESQRANDGQTLGKRKVAFVAFEISIDKLAHLHLGRHQVVAVEQRRQLARRQLQHRWVVY